MTKNTKLLLAGGALVVGYFVYRRYSAKLTLRPSGNPVGDPTAPTTAAVDWS